MYVLGGTITYGIRLAKSPSTGADPYTIGTDNFFVTSTISVVGGHSVTITSPDPCDFLQLDS